MAKRDGVYLRKDRRNEYWISWYDAQGRRRRRKTAARNVAQAQAARAGEILRVEQAKAIGFTPPGEESFEEVSKRFLSHQEARLTWKAFEREEGIIQKQLNIFFIGKIASIRRVDVQRFVTKRSGEVSAHSVQKELNVLKHILRLAVEWELIPINPAQGVKSPKVPPGRVRYLQPAELREILKASPDWLKPIVAIAACTGMRRSEILGLRWLDVDSANHRILLRQTKNGESRIVYLNRSVMTVIRSLPVGVGNNSTDKLFVGVTPGQVSVAFRRVCGNLKIEDFRFHDLRHTAASWLRMGGADIHTVALLLGHKDLRMAARYQHLSPSFLAEAVGRLDNVFGLVRHQSVTKRKALPKIVALSVAK